MELNATDTIVALSTAPGKAAVAMVRLSGPDAHAIVADHVRFAGKAKAFRHARARLGVLLEDGEKVLDQVLVLPFFAPRSYTGEALCEVHLHGSPWLVERAISLFCRRARAADPGEFTRRALQNGKLDLAQAEGVESLISARSAIAHDLAQRALRGEISSRVEQMRGRILRLLSLIEAELDFSQEEIEPHPAEDLLAEVGSMQETLERWISSYRLGRLVDGADVVLAGPPNAGKSTLMNALLGEERVIVSAEPGTTRDSISQSLSIGPLEVRLWDTAGLRDGGGDIEHMGMRHTRELLERADLVLALQPWNEPGLEEPGATNAVPVYTKMDQEGARTPSGSSGSGPRPVALSALSGRGIPELLKRIEEELVIHDVGDDMVVSQARHRQLLEAALEGLQRAAEALQADLDRSLVASDLRPAAEALGQIVGGFDLEEVLDGIFSRFCIGK